MSALADRVQELEEVAALQQLKFEYGRLIDTGLAEHVGFPQQALLDQFTDDAVWEANYHGRFEGKPAIADFFARVSESVSFSLHYT